MIEGCSCQFATKALQLPCVARRGAFATLCRVVPWQVVIGHFFEPVERHDILQIKSYAMRL